MAEHGGWTLEVIEDSPDELIRVPGIGRVRVERIKKSWAEQKEIKNIMLFLQILVTTGHDRDVSASVMLRKVW